MRHGVSPGVGRVAGGLLLAAVGLAGIAFGLAMASRGTLEAAPRVDATHDGSRIDRVASQCAEDMVRQTCRIMGSASSASVPDDAVIFVAGIGVIDAAVYNRLRADGEAMCETVRRSCRLDWDGPACRTARALYDGG